MKTIILGFAALLCCIVSVQAQEKYYGIKSGIVKSVTDDGTSTIEQTVWFDNYGDKQTTIQVTKIPGFGETKMYIIYLGDKMYSINDNMSEARESQRPPLNFLNPSPGFKLTELGKEKVLGKECTKYSYKQKQLLGSSTNTVWVWQGIVFHTLPGSSCVIPISSWQLSTCPGRMYFRMVRELASSWLPSS